MGGLVFTKGEDALHVPRMSPTIYKYVKGQCHAALRQLFMVVASPIDGPGKKDFGDIDIFVTWRKEGAIPGSTSEAEVGDGSPDALDTIALCLGAFRTQKLNPSAANFAIPWPKTLPSHTNDDPWEDKQKPRYIQVDVTMCSSLERLQWQLFKHVHGDMWNILGSIIRPLGLTADEVGLYLRIPEVERLNRKQAKVLLSTDPAQVLNFLRLRCDGPEWEGPFSTMEEMFEYTAKCRMFWVKPEKDTENADTDGERVGGEFEKTQLNSNDRRRMKQRSLFRKWIEEFLPKCRDERRFLNCTMTRGEVREDAFQRFGTKEQYEKQLFDFQLDTQTKGLRGNIKAWLLTVAETNAISYQQRGVLASAFWNIIANNDTSFSVRPNKSLKDDRGLMYEDEVERFVKSSWKEVLAVAWERHLETYHANLAKKRTE
ncbi:uncharacterized protein BCR38DRAFT_410574 [Pseudomassariella vexata]|uniref:Uncharacterized protein n=1 Tax=Pseudomassariella vexata TaxID=1141098 RepID=A0A1Y2DSK3_9PEZI|nr:uncharacterized protein BCR38DRAFT_410574 [Pseudomassariella vexata]ORY62129.1 hypothetical protein BCR38DRAFT_410574 [Pseudomassariella vexata]